MVGVLLIPVCSNASSKSKYYNEKMYASLGYEAEINNFKWGYPEDREKLKDKEGVLEVYDAITKADTEAPNGMLTEVSFVLGYLDTDVDVRLIKDIVEQGVEGAYQKKDEYIRVANLQDKVKVNREKLTAKDIENSFNTVREYFSGIVYDLGYEGEQKRQFESLVYLTMLEEGFELENLYDVVGVIDTLLKDTSGNIFEYDVAADAKMGYKEYLVYKDEYLYSGTKEGRYLLYKSQPIEGCLHDRVVNFDNMKHIEQYKGSEDVELAYAMGIKKEKIFILDGVYKAILARKTMTSTLVSAGITEKNITVINRRDKIDRVVEVAKSTVGLPYSQEMRSSLKAFDCSSLVWYCYNNIGVRLGEDWSNTDMQLRFAEAHKLTVSKNELQKGDLIYYSRNNTGHDKGVGHVGMYIGDGRMIDARSVKYGVVEREVDHNRVIAYVRPMKIVG